VCAADSTHHYHIAIPGTTFTTSLQAQYTSVWTLFAWKKRIIYTTASLLINQLVTRKRIMTRIIHDEEGEGLQIALVLPQPQPSELPQASPLPECHTEIAGESFVWAKARVSDPVSESQAIPPEMVELSVNVTPVVIDNETVTVSDISVTENFTNPDNPHGCLDRIPEVLHVDEGEPEVIMPPAAPSVCSLYRWNLFVFVFANSFLLVASASTISFEVGAGILYILGAIFHWIAEGFARIGNITMILQTLFRLLSILMLSLDLILSTVETLLSELLAWIAGILCTVFGGISVGLRMYEHIGGVCQWMRTKCRVLHEDWNPKRLRTGVLGAMEV
jgi:hypothetical protein